MSNLSDSITLFENFDISESSDSDIKIDGTYILARVKGPMFFPDAPSRNQRFYPRSLWENVCNNPSLREKMKNRNLYSTISHEIPYSDVTLAEGKYSHFITDMYIDDQGKGICEFYILGTPAGRILNTHLRAGCRMYSSTRADGGFTNETYEGMPVVDPNTYKFFGMDIVTEPGYLQAHPELVESLQEDYNKLGIHDHMRKSHSSSLNELRLSNSGLTSTNTSKGIVMSENTQLLESLTREATDARSKLSEALEQNAKLESELLIARDKMKQMSEEYRDYKDTMKKVAIYETFGTPEEIETVFDKVADLKDKLDSATSAYDKLVDELGTPEEIRHALSAAEEVIKDKSSFEGKFGTPEEVEQAFDSAKEFVDRMSSLEAVLGSPEEIEQALSAAEEYCSAMSAQEEELGSAAEIREAFNKTSRLLKEYRELGTPAEIRKAFGLVESHMARMKENKVKATAVKLAKELGMQATSVYEMLNRGLSESFIRNQIGKSSKYVKNGAASAICESVKRPASLGERLANIFYR